MKRIIVIDDNEDFRQTLKDMLEIEGYEVIEAADGQEGINQYRRQPADLVITDLIMPEKEGIETIIELRRDYPAVQIIAISGGGGGRYSSAPFLSAAKDLGALQSFQKPLDRQEFMAAVKKAITTG